MNVEMRELLEPEKYSCIEDLWISMLTTKIEGDLLAKTFECTGMMLSDIG